ncbi:cellulase family glycosylhydrolase [Streptomyces sp. NBC_00237]|uniref:cellulase family glycosylhydrolase n=1 Tax=Streptomyces sp. NBC_00237 TaxID=2975687 RepID=UPI00225591ED|nr:cellulase family glycosylhydrolase [Streptomyces sp. NBC_00237]MCX5206297.1 cellulase family glycosylhydrolase [Streptomyces sp. NBC_00237]
MKHLPRPAHRRGHGSGRLTALLVALLVVLGLAPTGTATAAPDAPARQAPAAVKVPARAMDAVAAMQPSWNLGNTLDAIPDETSWGNPKATRELFKAVRAEGFRSVRIPVTWSAHQSATAPFAVEAAYLNRVKQVVDWAVAENLYVVLNVHHDSWQWLEKISTTDHDQVLARFNSLWTQIAATFRSAPRTLLLEGINEPVFGQVSAARKAELMNELNTSFHKVVRASGGANKDRLLVLTTEYATPSQALMDNLNTTITSLRDSNLVATVHYYSWYPFSVNVAGGYRYDDAARNDLTDAFARMHHTFTSKGIPVYLGEYGLLSYPDHHHPARIERGEALKYYEQFGHAARRAGVTTALWDPFAYLDRATLKWRDPALFAVIKSSWTTRSGTASFDKVFVAKSEPIIPQSLTLHRNGTRFRGLWHGDTKLAEGRDYTLYEDRITLTKQALTRLTGNREYGVNATLQSRFSRGLPWQIDVVTYDKPTLADATGTAAAFAVPTKFQGDLLAAMEATYGDGSNAGQTEWTAFQEFNMSFSPDYPKDAITLTPGFLKTLRDGDPAILTFHFHSGAKAKYRITKSGDTVTGTTVKTP